MKSPNNALVLLSGGQDSVTCLFWALGLFQRVNAVAFDYGQKHSIELELAAEVAADNGVPLRIIRLQDLLAPSALTQHDKDVSAQSEFDPSLPASFTAGRNALFLTVAASYGYSINTFDLVTGTCQTDYSGYPDCRRVFIDSMVTSLSLAMGKDFKIHTPLMYLDKAETWQLANHLGALDQVRRSTNTCYNGVRDVLHDWGYGCGQCPSCKLRREGYYAAVNKGLIPGLEKQN